MEVDKNIKMLVFDLDGTLSISKTQMDSEMAQILTELLKTKKIAIISGANFPQYQKQIVDALKPFNPNFENLILCPACSSQYYLFQNGEYKKIYADEFTNEEKEKIINALKTTITELGFEEKVTYGEPIEDRGGTQITYSALGQNTPYEIKKDYDPDQKKRLRFRDVIIKKIPEFDVHVGGTSSIDVTKKGIDKAYGIRNISERSNTDISDMVFFGDAIFEGGNDYTVLKTGVKAIKVDDQEHTKKILRTLI